MEKIKILFVCMGNICRSPTAEAVFARLIQDHRLESYFYLDSAGTHSSHVGEPPDPRSQAVAKERGIDLAHLRARKVIYGDFEDFDYLLAMDDNNYCALTSACPAHYRHKIHYFLAFAPHIGEREVPDPYYTGRFGFERVLDLAEEASLGFIEFLQTEGHIPSKKGA